MAKLDHLLTEAVVQGKKSQLWRVYEFGFCEHSWRRGRAALVAHNFLNPPAPEVHGA